MWILILTELSFLALCGFLFVLKYSRLYYCINVVNRYLLLLFIDFSIPSSIGNRIFCLIIKLADRSWNTAFFCLNASFEAQITRFSNWQRIIFCSTLTKILINVPVLEFFDIFVKLFCGHQKKIFESFFYY